MLSNSIKEVVEVLDTEFKQGVPLTSAGQIALVQVLEHWQSRATELEKQVNALKDALDENPKRIVGFQPMLVIDNDAAPQASSEVPAR